MTVTRVLRKIGRITLYIVGFFLVLIIAAFILINSSFGKRIIKDKVQSYLTRKLNTKITIGTIDFSLPQWIEVNNIYIEDQRKDTLLFGEKLKVTLDMLKLIKGNTYISKVEMKNMYVNIFRPENDTVFNYQFIVNAFSSKDPSPVKKDTAALKLTLKKLVLDQVRLNYTDHFGGSNIASIVHHMDMDMSKFQPDRLQFKIDDLNVAGLDFSMITLKEAVQDTTKSAVSHPLQLTAEKLDLSKINVLMDNRVNGMFLSNNLEHLNLSSLDMDMGSGKVDAGKLLLDSSVIKFISPSPKKQLQKADTAIEASIWKVGLKELVLLGDSLQFDNNAAPPKEGLDFAHLGLSSITAVTKNVFYSSDSTSASVDQLSFKDKSGFRLDTTHARIAYTNKGISATELFVKTPQSILQNTLEMSYASTKQITSVPGQSTVRIKLLKSAVAVNDLYMLMPSLKKSMPPRKFANSIVKLNTIINGTLKELNIPVLQLYGFSGTFINAKAILYNITDSNNLGYDITLFDSHIPKADIIKFVSDDQATRLGGKIPMQLNIGTHIKGNFVHTIADMNIRSNAFSLVGKADLKNLKDKKRLKYAVNLLDSRVDKNFLLAVIPKGTVPPSIDLPALITLKGRAEGDMNNIAPNLILGGSYGTIAVKGYVHNFKNKERADYDLDFSTGNFQLGTLLKKDSLIGNITLTGSAKGQGFNYKTMRTNLSTTVEHAGFYNYDYHDIDLNISLDDGDLNSNGQIRDSNLQFRYVANASLKGKYPSKVKASFYLDTIQLKALHLYKDSLDASLKATINAANLDPGQLDVALSIDSTRLRYLGTKYMLDTIAVGAVSGNGSTLMNIHSPFVDLQAKGNFEFDKIGPSMLQYIDKYYNIENKPRQNIASQQLSFKGQIKSHPLIMDIVPLLNYSDISFSGDYNSRLSDSSLNINAVIPFLMYKNNRISNGKIDVSSTEKDINSTVKFDTLVTGQKTFYGTTLNAGIGRDSLNVAVITKDKKQKDRYGGAATIIKKDKAYTISLTDDLLLNYKKWNVAKGNKLLYSPGGYMASQFALSNKNQRIVIQSKEERLNAPIDFTIDSFDIRDITAMMSNDTLLASGTLNGKFTVSGFEKQIPSFEGNLDLNRFEFKQQPVGSLHLTAQKKDDNTIGATAKLNDNGNDIDIKGEYYLNNKDKQFDAAININRLRMVTLQAFSNGSLARSSGDIRGKVTLDGKLDDPHWKGGLEFDTSLFTVTKTGVPYFIDRQKIALDYPTVSLDSFTVRDSAGHSMIFDGEIKSNGLTDYDLSVEIYGHNFTVVNAPKAIDNQLYGFAALNAEVSVSGTTTSPDIEGNLSLTDKSDVTIVLPERNINKDAGKSVVRFIDLDTFALPEKKPFVVPAEKKSSFAQFLNYNLNIALSKQAALTIVIDPSSGDELKVQGDADLNAGVDHGGNIVLSGNYELNSGHYILTYQFLKRQFDLLPGSTITFGGTPLDAGINISAEYVVNTSSAELLGNEVGDVDPKIANTFKQKIPYRVILYLKGTIKKPEISFDILLPEESSGINSSLRSTVENKLAQLRGDEAGTNKQVFSLLLLGRFTGEQSTDFFKGNGTSFDEMARESVSKFLSSALDQIASDLVKGVDIDLNVNTFKDYSSGDEQQRTDLNVAVTKRFLNDRLSLTVGKNFGIEGQDANAKATQEKGNAFLPDVTVNYKLSKDGKYAMRVYRKSQFEVILDGYVIETGMAFIVTMDYEKFRELFERKKIKKRSK